MTKTPRPNAMTRLPRRTLKMSIPLRTGNGFIWLEAQDGWTVADIAAMQELCERITKGRMDAQERGE